MAFESLEGRALLTALPFGASPHDTGEFMLGDVHVSVVLMESDGTIDPIQETWTPERTEYVKGKVEEGLHWWSDLLAAQSTAHPGLLNFTIDFTYADNPVPTGYEPIARKSNDFQFWIYDFLNLEGFNSTGSFSEDIRAFNHAQRVANEADWAFTIFVVNDENDDNGQFAPGGSFSRAFAFAGGRFFVMPAGRPASTVAHETGHMFWARDEYPGGGSYQDTRGYYDAQNWNAWDNPTSGFVQADSIMDRGERLQNAYFNVTTSPSSMEMIGWRDSNGNGIFDVLDVPHTLDGSGWFDPEQEAYRFVGHSAVQTLPNLNSSGTQNDMTLNRIRLAEYRLDGGPWQTAAAYDSHAAELDLAIEVLPSDFEQIEIRTFDYRTGVSSLVFRGESGRPTSTLQPGISGFVWNDLDADGEFTPGEPGLDGWTVQLVDSGGQPLELLGRVEPDDYAANTVLNNVEPGVTLTAVGGGVADGSVIARQRATASTGNQVFAHHLSATQISTEWTSQSRNLRIDFDEPVTTLSLDAIGHSSILAHGRLEIYDAEDNLLDRYTTDGLASGQFDTMTLSRPTAEIAYAIARSHAGTTVRLDNLRFGPEAAAVTDAHGAFALPHLEPGTYNVQVLPASHWSATTATTRTVTVAAGESVGQVDFGQQGAVNWQNPANPLDVNNDGVVSPIDALHVINELNLNGARELPTLPGGVVPPPFLDVNGDGFVSPADALQVINYLNSADTGNGEAPADAPHGAAPATTAGEVEPAAPATGEGETHNLASVDDRPARPLAASTQPGTSSHTPFAGPRFDQGLQSGREVRPEQPRAIAAQPAESPWAAASPAQDQRHTSFFSSPSRAAAPGEDGLEDVLQTIAEDITAAVVERSLLDGNHRH